MVLELLAAITLAPWAHPLAFRPLPGWQTGASGNVASAYDNVGRSVRVPKESAAWIATNVRYRNRATADPPNRTLANLRRDGIVVWAVIFQARPGRQKPIRLDLVRARHLPCCEGAHVAGGVYELTGLGPQRTYSVIVRVYFGSRPTRVVRSQAQLALNRLQLPLPRWQTFRAHGISVRYPPRWHATARRLTLVTYPPQILAVASYPLPHGNGGADGCSPKQALDRLQPGGAFIFGWEYTQPGSFRERDFPPRPEHFRLTHFSQYECGGPSYLLRFRQAGRFFQIHVALGRRASRATRATAIRVLDSFRVNPM